MFGTYVILGNLTFYNSESFINITMLIISMFECIKQEAHLKSQKKKCKLQFVFNDWPFPGGWVTLVLCLRALHIIGCDPPNKSLWTVSILSPLFISKLQQLKASEKI